MNTVDISNMRQMGLAAALYQEETDHYALWTGKLVKSGHIPESLCVSPQDTSPQGIANELVAFYAAHSNLYKSLITPYPRSYVSFGDFGFKEENFLQHVVPSPGAGWLICVSQSSIEENRSPFSGGWRGSYQRLLLDGSVVTRQHYVTPISNSESKWDPLSLFTDMKP